jgi:hypothetical protein
MTVLLSPVGGVAAQFFDNNGNPLSGGKLYSYAAGTTTPAATYTSSLGVTAHTNPIVLDSGGRVPGGEIWLTDGVIYKFVLQTSTNVLIATYDNIVGINSNFVNYTTEQEIQTATAGQTVFNLTTTQYQPGTNSLSVYVDGVNQYGPGAQYAYLETDSDTVTFVSGLHVGASVKFTTATQTTGNATDASVVAYTPPFTGGVATNVEDKLAQTISVQDFGAVGDGVTDDTVAIQAAIDNSVSGVQIYFPPGTYKTTAALKVKTDTVLAGSNRDVCVIQNSVSTILTTNEPTATRYYEVVIKELTFDGVAVAGQIGINLPHVSFSKLERVAVFNCATGIYYIAETSGGTVTGAYYNSIYDPLVSDCTNGIVFDKTANENSVYGGKITDCDAGAYLGSVNSVKFIATAFEGNVTYGAAITGYNCSLISCRFEGNNTCTGVNNNPTTGVYSNYVYAPHFQGLLASYNDVTGTLTIIDDSGMNLGVRTHVTAFHTKRTASGSLPLMYLEDTGAASGNPSVYKSSLARTTGKHIEGVNESGTAVWGVNYYGQYECFTANRGIFLRSPNGSRWEIYVTNAGTIAVAAA